MSEMRSALRAYVALDPSPATVLQRLDAFVSSQSAAEQIVTVAYGVVPPDRSTVTLSLAGHPPPLIGTPGFGVEVLAEGTGSALGVGAGPWPEMTVDLVPGRVLLLYSNGLVETRERELTAGIDQLAAHVVGIPERRRQPRELCARLAGLMGDDHGEDDVTLLAVSASRGGDARRVSTRLSAGPVAAGEARRFVTGQLREWDVAEDTVDAAELCVSELVTNAVIHTGTAIEVSVHLDADVVTVLVRDGGGQGTVSVRATDADDDPLAVSGRGLGLVDVIATAWAAEHGADGTTVWFELDRC
jgi:anti-sigma regulatory factor (Ser/Thr protein kinase)